MKFGFTINKDHKLEGEHLDASYLWKVSGEVNENIFIKIDHLVYAMPYVLKWAELKLMN